MPRATSECCDTTNNGSLCSDRHKPSPSSRALTRICLRAMADGPSLRPTRSCSGFVAASPTHASTPTSSSCPMARPSSQRHRPFGFCSRSRSPTPSWPTTRRLLLLLEYPSPLPRRRHRARDVLARLVISSIIISDHPTTRGVDDRSMCQSRRATPTRFRSTTCTMTATKGLLSCRTQTRFLSIDLPCCRSVWAIVHVMARLIDKPHYSTHFSRQTLTSCLQLAALPRDPESRRPDRP